MFGGRAGSSSRVTQTHKVHKMKQASAVVVVVVILTTIFASHVECAAGGEIESSDKPVARFRMNPYHANIGQITEIGHDGVVKISDVSNPRFALNNILAGQSDLAEGRYLGIVADEFVVTTRDSRLVRVQVTSIGKDNTAELKLAPDAAAKLTKHESIYLFRPPGATTAELESAPDFAPIDDGTEATVLGSNAANTQGSLSRSRNNLKQIGLAMHNFHDIFDKFPPAVVYGPDGKPWHSWRVLILPYVDAAPLFEKYRFDEPWNGPNNKKLLSEMPDVYRDPVDPSTDYFTNYAAATGAGTAFPGGIKMDPEQPTAWGANLESSDGAIAIRSMTDGTSNTVMVGTVSSERKIPWMKPEDVSFDKEYPRPGEKGGFDAPYRNSRGKGGVFLYGDGSVRTIRDDVEEEDWKNLLLISDGNVVGDPPQLSGRPSGRRAKPAAQFIEIHKTGDNYKARLTVGE